MSLPKAARPMARVKIQRSKELLSKLEALKSSTRDAVRLVMEREAEKICAMMRRLSPVDDGDLRASIGWTWGDAPRKSIFVRSKFSDMRITIFAGNEKAFYASWVEFGTAPHATGKGSDISSGGRKQFGQIHPGSAPQPFFFVSYRAMKKQVTAAINKAIRVAVRKAVR